MVKLYVSEVNDLASHHVSGNSVLLEMETMLQKDFPNLDLLNVHVSESVYQHNWFKPLWARLDCFARTGAIWE